MNLPLPFLESLQGLPGYNPQDFLKVHEHPTTVSSVRLNPLKSSGVRQQFTIGGISTEPVPWTDGAYNLSRRPSFTFDPLFHGGCYYVQESSSMFLEQALKQTVDLRSPLRVLDLCAAPGGKSTHIHSLISKDSLLVSNEVIRQRIQSLKENVIKWGTANVAVTSNDPRDFSGLKGYFDVIVVDAPCSGSGLFRKDAQAVNEWSENNVMLCSRRQQRILGDILPALKEDGILIYSTCSYSYQENEAILDWLTDQFPVSNIPLELSEKWPLTLAPTPRGNVGYRFWPHHAKGEGFFLAVFKHKAGTTQKFKAAKPVKAISRQLQPLVSRWADIGETKLLDVHNQVYAWPGSLDKDYSLLLQHLRIIYSGTLLGAFAHHKFIPEHALAMSDFRHPDIPRVEVDLETAIAYLQKRNIILPELSTGWQLLENQSHVLGWINVLKNRINNYYPKEMRILKR